MNNCKNTWISSGLPSSNRGRSRGEGREEGEGFREKGSAIEVDVGVGGAKSEIKVENRRGHESSAEDFSKNVRAITVVGIVIIVIVSHHSARASISMLDCNVNICAYIGFLGVSIKARGGTTSRGTRRGTAI